MGNSPVIAALHTTIHVSSASEKPLRQKSTLGGKIYTPTPTPTYNHVILTFEHTQIRRNARITPLPSRQSPPETLQILHQQRRLPRRAPRRSPRRLPTNTRHPGPPGPNQTSRRKRRRTRRRLRRPPLPPPPLNLNRMQRNSRALPRTNHTPRTIPSSHHAPSLKPPPYSIPNPLALGHVHAESKSKSQPEPQSILSRPGIPVSSLSAPP